MNAFESYLHSFLFSAYPYICMVVFLVGSLARFDRDQYTWKSDSSQMLRTGTLRWGSNLFHVGILFLFFGHLVGLLTPHWVYEPFISPAHKQLLAITAGGVASTQPQGQGCNTTTEGNGTATTTLEQSLPMGEP